MKHKPENEIPKHQKKKGSKNFIIQRKMTQKEALRKLDKERQRILEECQWLACWTKYETEKQAQQGLDKIERDKKQLGGFNFHKGYDHRIIENKRGKK